MKATATAVLLCAASAAAAEGVTLRFAAIAPDGSAWARELRAFARDVTSQSGGELQFKWYMGGIAGDDVQVNDRVKRGQLDGIMSGGMLCDRLSPTMRAVHLLTDEREEAGYVLRKLRPVVEAEFRKEGFVFLGSAGVGPAVYYTREPIRDLADLRRARLWVWDIDLVVAQQVAKLGIPGVPLPLTEASGAYDAGKVDGFVSLPTAALVFQWSAQARWVTDLRLGFTTACALVSNRAFDALPVAMRDVVRSSYAKLAMRFEDVGAQQDRALLNGLFARQGLKPNAISPTLRAQYLAARGAGREQLGPELVPKPDLERVARELEEHRKGTH